MNKKVKMRKYRVNPKDRNRGRAAESHKGGERTMQSAKTLTCSSERQTNTVSGEAGDAHKVASFSFNEWS